MNLIITGANKNHFGFLELFVRSLRERGKYEDKIVVCDNVIGGDRWDEPGKYAETISFSDQHMAFLKEHNVEVIPYHQLIKDNEISREQIDQIPSYTQRYPHKYVYTTLISKRYKQQVKNICFFDADIYFQKPVAPIFDAFQESSIYMVKEYQKIGKSPFLRKWIAHSDFSQLSDQAAFEETMFGSDDYCTGFFGGPAEVFHQLTLLALLLSSNRLVEFYSDQPLMNILKSFFRYPIQELPDDYVKHLGELPKEDLTVKNGQVLHRNKASIAVHFNGGTKDLFEKVSTDEPVDYGHSTNSRMYIKSKKKIRQLYHSARKLYS